MRNIKLVLIILICSLFLLVGGWTWQQWNIQRTMQGGQSVDSALVLPVPRSVPAFSLTDQHGQPFGLDQLRNHWSLLFFGFTHCPDICPNTLSLLHGVNSAFRQDGQPAQLQVVFVSVDPGRDTPDVLKRYTEYFDADFAAVTGTETELQKLTGALYVPYTRVPAGQDDDYTVEHSGALVLLNPQGQAVAYFSPPLQLGPIVDDLRVLLKG